VTYGDGRTREVPADAAGGTSYPLARPPRRQKPKKHVKVGLEITYEAIENLLKRRPDLGNNPTDFVRRLIVAALQKHQPLKKG
jgi:hypothetical protein